MEAEASLDLNQHYFDILKWSKNSLALGFWPYNKKRKLLTSIEQNWNIYHLPVNLLALALTNSNPLESEHFLKFIYKGTVLIFLNRIIRLYAAKGTVKLLYLDSWICSWRIIPQSVFDKLQINFPLQLAKKKQSWEAICTSSRTTRQHLFISDQLVRLLVSLNPGVFLGYGWYSDLTCFIFERVWISDRAESV